MRRFTVLISCCLLMTTLIAADDLKPITAAEAAKSAGQPVVLVEMKVQTAKDRRTKRGIIYLDSESDFKDKDNLGVAISAEAAEKFKKKGIDDPASHFEGKRIRVKGCVMIFEERPYLPVHDPDQITIIK